MSPESLTSEPEFDWDDEEVAADLVVIPSVSSSEMYEIMVDFAKQQPDPTSIQLLHVLNGKKPLRLFKEKINELANENQWYAFEKDVAKSKMAEWLEEVSNKR